MINLDYLCMKYGNEIAECEGKKTDKENLVTKALGVLQENGPYAMFLYLEDHSKKDIASYCKRTLLNLFRKEQQLADCIKSEATIPPKDDEFPNIMAWLREVSSDVDRLFFLKKICQQVLIYARYHIKALEETEEGKV